MLYDPLIKHIAKKFYNIEKEDLIQAGYLGLIKARNNYHDGTDVKFGTYAYKYIFGEMYELSLKSRNIKLNKKYLNLYRSINKCKNLLCQKYNRDVSNQEICEYLGIEESELSYISTLMEDMLSLDDIYNNIQCGYYESDGIKFDEYLELLSDEEKNAIIYRYKYDYTQSETASILGINQVKVSRLEKCAKNKIREYIY